MTCYEVKVKKPIVSVSATKIVFRADHSFASPIEKVTVHRTAPGGTVPPGDYVDGGVGNWLDIVDVSTTAGEFDALSAHVQDPAMVVIVTICQNGAVATYNVRAANVRAVNGTAPQAAEAPEVHVGHTWYYPVSPVIRALRFLKDVFWVLPSTLHELRALREEVADLREFVRGRGEPPEKSNSDYPPAPAIPVEH